MPKTATHSKNGLHTFNGSNLIKNSDSVILWGKYKKSTWKDDVYFRHGKFASKKHRHNMNGSELSVVGFPLHD